MVRRNFIKTSAFALGLGLVDSNNLLTEISSSYPSRVTTLFFPEGKQFADFRNDLGQWMNVEKWRLFLAAQKDSGALVDIRRTVRANSVTYNYKFKSQSDLNRFEIAAHSICCVNLAARENLGYRDDVSILA